MTPYVLKYISLSEKDMFEVIALAVKNMKDIPLGCDENGNQIILSCHMLSRAVSAVFSLPCEDGYFSHSYEHSWVRTPNGNIIDVYPVGMIGGPILCFGGRLSPYTKLYAPKPTKEISMGRFSKQSFRRSVKKVKRALVASCHELMKK